MPANVFVFLIFKTTFKLLMHSIVCPHKTTVWKKCLWVQLPGHELTKPANFTVSSSRLFHMTGFVKIQVSKFP